MIEKIGQYWDKKDVIKGYNIRVFLFVFFMCLFLILNGYLFNNWAIIIVGSFVMNVIRNVSGGYHCTTLEGCILFTNVHFLIVGTIIKFTYKYFITYYILLILSIIGTFVIYKRAYVGEPEEKERKDYKYLSKTTCLFFICLALLGKLLNCELISQCILWGIIMTATLMFENKKSIKILKK